MRLILFTLALFFVFAASAQTSAKLKLDENTIVVDSTGYRYPYAIWINLLRTGLYTLKPTNPKNPNEGMLIARLTEEEIKRRDEKAPKPKESPFFTTGKTFQRFKLKDMEGRKYTLNDLKGKVVVMNFWFINCPPCKMEIPQLNKLVKEFNPEEVVFIAVALDSYSELRDFLKSTPFDYHIVDDGRYFAQDNGVKSFPTHVVLDKESKIYYHTTGLSTATVPWLKRSIQELLKN
jgi:thiol-disulfide isomerase/thioredoxin